MVTSYAWFLYLAVPFYVVYLGASWLMSSIAESRESVRCRTARSGALFQEAAIAAQEGKDKKEKKDRAKLKISRR